MRVPHERDDSARRPRHLVERALGGANEAGPEEQVLGGIPRDRELGEEEQVDAEPLRFFDASDDPVAVAVEIADDGVDLGESETQFSPFSRKPSLPAMEIVIDSRFNGPPDSGNGGYTCGLLAAIVGEPCEVTLRAPPPLGRPLRFDGERLWDDDQLVAEARRGELDVEPPPPVAFDDAAEASTRYPGFREHAYPTCFVCGPARDDGLRLFTGPTGDGLFAAPLVPSNSLLLAMQRALVWAALDCPGAIAVGDFERAEWLLGRMTARVDDVPRAGERCVVAARPLGREGRKAHAVTAAYGEDERLLGVARQTWIEPR
jgi:hypothetical protein